MAALVLKYPDVLNLFGVHAMKERTESRAFLAWFLENYYRLDQMEVSDCICDGRFDKGIDGIYVNEQLGQIDIFQSFLVHSQQKTIGDTALKEFHGTMSQFSDKAAAENLIKTSQNQALTSLLKNNDIANKIHEGFVVRGIFLTNAARDQNAIDFLAENETIILFDRDELQNAYSPLDKTAPIAKAISFSVAGIPCIDYQLSRDVNMVIAPLSATDLLNMGGIASGELFAWNVRQWLRKTKVNRDIEKSIKNSSDHQLFPAFHNGLTVLCKRLKVKGERISISGYAVVNGCQSLRSLYENRKDITDDLRIITKFINVPPDNQLAAKITDHTNNQNGITFRDLQSNNPIQVRLQSEVNRDYPGEMYYRIKRGEHPAWPEDKVIENELVARVLLAFDLKEPSSCHQTYKLFDELHAAIFGRPEVNADRILLAHDLHRIVLGLLDSMQNELFGKYSLTRYVIIYLIREALETDEVGGELCKNPSEFLKSKPDRVRLAEALTKVASVIVRLLDAEVTRRNRNETDFFDYKSDLKSPSKIREIRAMIISQFQISVDGTLAPNFATAWAQSAKKKKTGRTKKKKAARTK